MESIINYFNEALIKKDSKINKDIYRNKEALIDYIQNIIDTYEKSVKGADLQTIMDEVKEHTKGYSDYDYIQVERHFNIKKTYPSHKVNIEQWIMAKINIDSKI
jgi:hypothetical protein